MFEKILIANRGEIACRIIRTARRLGVATVAVYSDADEGALHVALADEGVRIGPAPPRESYLATQKILEAARRSGAEAVHPGYGFLAENADFAEACAAAGIVFIGPPPEAIRAMGSKVAAKALMEEAGVPVVPGWHGDDQSVEGVRRAAEGIGWPLLIKASAGGGGKGMRVVREEADFADALAGARREAAAAFGDDRVLFEKYLERPRHVEIQVFADRHGSAVHLFERDCSIQRRYQKIIEEAPAPGLSAEVRARMGEAAVTAARAVGYVGAGTVEFLLDEDGSFYFMEMNTRLQVEHPVTEMITGEDLVEWQLRTAAGEPLPLSQGELTARGHAIEARIYAEDPARDFLPAAGRLRHLRLPVEDPHVRVDAGVRQGDEIGIHYDPLIAKLIVWDGDRDGALRRLKRALADFQAVGTATNLEFLAAVAAHRAFAAGEIDTGFIERHRETLFPAPEPPSDRVLALGALSVLLRRAQEGREAAAAGSDPWSPWHRTDGWRLNTEERHLLVFRCGAERLEVAVRFRGGAFLLELPGGAVQASGSMDADGELTAEIGGRRCRGTVVRRGSELTVLTEGRSRTLLLEDGAAEGAEEEDVLGKLIAPMPGRIVAVMAQAGDRVRRGAPLIVLEAMKMEHTLTAPSDGTVTALPYAPGAMVSEGAELIAFEPQEGSP